MPRLIIPLLATTLTLSSAGCGTLANVFYWTDYEGGKRIYGGVRSEWTGLKRSTPLAFQPQQPGGVKPSAYQREVLLTLFDLPCSLVGDTLTLPITIPATFLSTDGSAYPFTELLEMPATPAPHRSVPGSPIDCTK